MRITPIQILSNSQKIRVIRVMEKTVITTNNAPAPIGPYNQAIQVGEPNESGRVMLFISGQICIDPSTGDLKNKDLQEETHQVMHNLKAILQEAGMDFGHVVKTTIFITDMSRFSEMNEVYGKYFSNNFPARETVQVSALPKFANVEISMIAVK
jgi:2-iminobutanoate/2-iminopropanoate deaminase